MKISKDMAQLISRSVAFSPDGSRIVSSAYGEIRVWSRSTSTALARIDQDQLLASTNEDLSKWSLCLDGWIRGAHNELLLWVPS